MGSERREGKGPPEGPHLRRQRRPHCGGACEGSERRRRRRSSRRKRTAPSRWGRQKMGPRRRHHRWRWHQGRFAERALASPHLRCCCCRRVHSQSPLASKPRLALGKGAAVGPVPAATTVDTARLLLLLAAGQQQQGPRRRGPPREPQHRPAALLLLALEERLRLRPGGPRWLRPPRRVGVAGRFLLRRLGPHRLWQRGRTGGGRFIDDRRGGCGIRSNES